MPRAWTHVHVKYEARCVQRISCVSNGGSKGSIWMNAPLQAKLKTISKVDLTGKQNLAQEILCVGCITSSIMMENCASELSAPSISTVA